MTRTSLVSFMTLFLAAGMAGGSAALAEPVREPEPLEEGEGHVFPDRQGIFTAALENDLFAGEDNNYTNGVRFSWFSSETGVPGWLDHVAGELPFFAAEGNKRYGFTVGQSMFTPTDIERRTPDPRDRPYAGWSYAGLGLVSDSGDQLDSIQLQLGVVGPASGAAETQDFVHDLIGSPDPQGWDDQLENELGVALFYERKWRNLYQASPFGFGFDISPHVGGAIGNVYTHAATGATIRFGYDLPSDYGPPRIQPSLPGSDFFVPTQSLGWYVFAGVEGRAIGRNIFLDGNTFRDSPSVDKKYFVADAQVGLAVTYDAMRIAYTHIFRTEEFEGQESPDSFGALTLSYRY